MHGLKIITIVIIAVFLLQPLSTANSHTQESAGDTESSEQNNQSNEPDPNDPPEDTSDEQTDDNEPTGGDDTADPDQPDEFTDINPLFIQLQTGTEASGKEELIELFNPRSVDLDLSNWLIEYYPASRDSIDNPSKTIPLDGIIASGNYFVLASEDYLLDQRDMQFSSGLAATGGHLVLVHRPTDSAEDVTVADIIAWGSAKPFETSVAPAPGKNESLQRRIDAKGYYIDTDDNAKDLGVNSVLSLHGVARSPGINDQPIEPDEPDDDPTDTGEEPGVGGDSPSDPTVLPALAQVQITELLPNPGPPLLDSEDEYVELFNPTSGVIDLTGLRLQTGKTFNYSYNLDGLTIQPQSYLVLYSRDTNLTLSNSEGKARIIDEFDRTVFETDSYTTAKNDIVWALIGGVWQFSSAVTPGGGNVAAATTTAKKASTAKSSSSSKKSTSKTSASERADFEEPPAVPEVSEVNNSVIAGVGGVALLYTGYEYRFDMRRFLRRFRRNA